MVNSNSLRRVLIVSPHFPPVNAADHQRVRMSLPYLKQFGWQATVLAVHPAGVEGASLDPLLLQTVPDGVPVVRTDAVSYTKTRPVGLGNFALRALPYLKAAGDRLLQDGGFDLVFFSTTQFPVTILGPQWLRRFGVRYVVDFQDPWLDDYYERTGARPPGGKLRHGVSRFLAARLEPRVMRDVSAVINVSPAYVQTLRARYPQLQARQFSVLPFGAPEKDFELLSKLPASQHVFDKHDGNRHLVYIGRAGDDMRASLCLLFEGLRRNVRENPARWGNVRLHFVGTSYAREGKAHKTVEPIAQEFQVRELVQERTSRIGYFEALQALLEADGLLVLGSDSAAYTPSKIYPYVLAKRPLLALLHRDSPAVSMMARCRAGYVVTFADGPDGSESVEATIRALQAVRSDMESETVPDVEWQEFNQYSAREMTRRQCEVFDAAAALRETGGPR